MSTAVARLFRGGQLSAFVVYIGFVAIIAFFAIALSDRGFLTPGNMMTIIRQTTPVTIMYVLVHISRIASHRGSAVVPRWASAQKPPHASATTARTFDSIVKKLKKFATTVGRCAPHSVVAAWAISRVRMSCAMIAAAASTAAAMRR